MEKDVLSFTYLLVCAPTCHAIVVAGIAMLHGCILKVFAATAALAIECSRKLCVCAYSLLL